MTGIGEGPDYRASVWSENWPPRSGKRPLALFTDINARARCQHSVAHNMAEQLAAIAGLSDIASWASAEEIRLTQMLVENGQAHMFAKWTACADADKKHSFYNQVGVQDVYVYASSCAVLPTRATAMSLGRVNLRALCAKR